MATTQAERTQAFAEFYQQHYAWVFRFLKVRGRLHHDDAEELAQDTFARLYTLLEREPDLNASLILRPVADRVLFDHYRANARRSHLELAALSLDSIEGEIGDARLELEHSLELQELSSALASLGHRSQLVLLLVAAGYSRDEIAARLGVSLDQVLEAKATARRELRAALEQPAPAPPPLSTITRRMAEDAHPSTEAEERGRQLQRRMLASRGGALSPGEAAERLGITMEQLTALRRTDDVLALEDEHGDLHFPVWQFTDHGILPGVSEVVKALADRGPWGAMTFLLTANGEPAGQTPLDALLAGRRDDALRAAAAAQLPV